MVYAELMSDVIRDCDDFDVSAKALLNVQPSMFPSR